MYMVNARLYRICVDMQPCLGGGGHTPVILLLLYILYSCCGLVYSHAWASEVMGIIIVNVVSSTYSTCQ